MQLIVDCKRVYHKLSQHRTQSTTDCHGRVCAPSGGCIRMGAHPLIVAGFGRLKGEVVPVYQYICNDCDELHEEQQSFHDDALTTCPKCGGALRKVFGAAGVVFKGSGFYITDYRSEGYKQAAKKESDSAKPAGGESKPSSGGEAKSSAKADDKPAKASSAKA